MGRKLRAVHAVTELLSGIGLVGLARLTDGDSNVEYLAVGFASGFLYRHTQTGVIGGGFRASPLWNAVLAAVWTPLCVAIDRSAGGCGGRWAFAAGINLGSAAHWLARRE